MISSNNTKWPEINLPETNELLKRAIKALQVNPCDKNKEMVYELLKGSVLLVATDKIPRRSKKIHINMLALSFPGNIITLLAFTDRESLVKYSPESSIIAVSTHHLLDICLKQYSGGLVINPLELNMKISQEQIREILKK
jgi:hypothetical protein